MAPGILTAVRPLGLKVLFILTMSGAVVGVIEFVRSIRGHR
jgi:hypothetical protein